MPRAFVSGDIMPVLIVDYIYILSKAPQMPEIPRVLPTSLNFLKQIGASSWPFEISGITTKESAAYSMP